MKQEELRVGMTVRANELSNSRYRWTTERYGCIGTVVTIYDEGFKLEITNHDVKSEIGNKFDVDAKYFDKEEIGKMRIELKEEKINMEIGYGDLLVFEKGQSVLVMKDYDGTDYRGVVLGDNYVTDYKTNQISLLEHLSSIKGFGKLVRVIKADNLKLSEV